MAHYKLAPSCTMKYDGYNPLRYLKKDRECPMCGYLLLFSPTLVVKAMVDDGVKIHEDAYAPPYIDPNKPWNAKCDNCDFEQLIEHDLKMKDFPGGLGFLFLDRLYKYAEVKYGWRLL